MPLVNIQMKVGKTIEQKRVLAREITNIICKTVGSAPEKVRIVFSEIEDENYSLGGKLDIDKNS